MRNFLFGFLILLIAITITGRNSSSNGSSSAGQAAAAREPGVRCTVDAEAVRRDGDRILASGTYRCPAGGPDRLEFYVSLQRRTGDDWVVVSREGFVPRSDQTGWKQTSAQRRKQVAGPCAAGTFRTFVDAISFDQGNRRTYTDTGREFKNPC